MVAILLLDLQTNKCIALPIFSQIHIIYVLIFPIMRDPGPRYKWVGKSLTCNKHVGFKALCNKQVGFKALVISNSFSSFLIGCVRRPTPRTDKGSSSITDNMITFNGISVLNFKFKRYSLKPKHYMSQSFIFNILCNLQVSDWGY